MLSKILHINKKKCHQDQTWHSSDIHQHAQTWSNNYFVLLRRRSKNPGGFCWGGTLLVDWLGTWHSVRIAASPSCSQFAADWLSAVDLITLRLLAVTLRSEADVSKPRGGIYMSGRAWTVHVREASSTAVRGNIPVPEKAPPQHCVSPVRHAVEFIRRSPLGVCYHGDSVSYFPVRGRDSSAGSSVSACKLSHFWQLSSFDQFCS